MHQVLFTIPIPFFPNLFPSGGIPIYGFGAMLFLAFIAATIWGTRRAARIGMTPTKFQDFEIWVFIAGMIGARILYMIQYSQDFPNTFVGIIKSFFMIWEGGIIFYGSVLGGIIGYGLFYYFVMRRLQISGWQLADVVAPLLALGLAIGRIGCYLNGCCWGQVACEPNATVPLGTAHFPLLPAPARGQLVDKQDLQTSLGFSSYPRQRLRLHKDPRTMVNVVELHSPAERAGLLHGDRIIQVDGHPNEIYVDLFGSDSSVEAALAAMKTVGARERLTKDGRISVAFSNLNQFYQGQDAAAAAAPLVDLATPQFPDAPDYLNARVREWPRGKSTIELTVERNGREVELSFEPLSIGLYPTQLYETVSMVLLILFLLAYYPYRRHDGELMVVLMIGYAVHRFINESLRIEPAVGWGLTLSQWGSVVIFVAGIGLEAYLWRVMPSRWRSKPPESPDNMTTAETHSSSSPIPQPAN